MQISMWVPYDEERLRRTLKFIVRPQLKRIRVLGCVMVVLGLPFAALEPSESMAYFLVILGLIYVTVIGPTTVARCMRVQSKIVKDGFQMTLDQEWVTMVYPLTEMRYRWAGLDRVVDTPDAWYGMIGKAQALTIPKDLMTEQQRAEFAAFLGGLGSAREPATHTG